MVFRMGSGSERKGRSVREGLKFGSSLQFVPRINVSLDRARSDHRIGVRPPRLALVSSIFVVIVVVVEVIAFQIEVQDRGVLFQLSKEDRINVQEFLVHVTWPGHLVIKRNCLEVLQYI